MRRCKHLLVNHLWSPALHTTHYTSCWSLVSLRSAIPLLFFYIMKSVTSKHSEMVSAPQGQEGRGHLECSKRSRNWGAQFLLDISGAGLGSVYASFFWKAKTKSFDKQISQEVLHILSLLQVQHQPKRVLADPTPLAAATPLMQQEGGVVPAGRKPQTQ